MPRISDSKSDIRAAWRGFDQAMTIVGELIAAVAVWGGAGYGLDRLFHTPPVFFLIGVFVGWGAWVLLTYRRGFPPESTMRKEEPKA